MADMTLRQDWPVMPDTHCAICGRKWVTVGVPEFCCPKTDLLPAAALPPARAEVTIVEFLTARLDDDEAVAQAARPHEHLRTRDNASLAVVEDDGYSTCSITSGRVLREIEAKRRIIAFALTYRESAEQETVASRKFIAEIMAETAEDALKPLAAVYADHEDFQEEWKQ